jgi:hypothetical protein
VKGSNERLSNIGACNTASSPPNINPTDEANAPLIYAAISAKCSDDGHAATIETENNRNVVSDGKTLIATVSTPGTTQEQFLASVAEFKRAAPDKYSQALALFGGNEDDLINYLAQPNGQNIKDAGAASVARKENIKTSIDQLKTSDDPFAQKLGAALSTASPEVQQAIFKDAEAGRGTEWLTGSLGELLGGLVSDDVKISILIKDAELRVSAKQDLDGYQAGVRAQAAAERDALKGRVEGVRAQFGDAAATVYELTERARIAAEEAARINIAATGQSLLDFTKAPVRNTVAIGQGALEGVAGTLDAIFRDDRTPLQIYADVKTKLNITIDNWERMTPQEQADAIGRLRGNISAELTKAAVTGGAAAGIRAVGISNGVRIESAAAGAVAGETAEAVVVRDLIDKPSRREPDADLGARIFLNQTQIDSILAQPKGSRPDPVTYLSPQQIEAHLSHFQGGVVKIKAQPSTGTEGPPGGTFVLSRVDADRVIAESRGNPRELERLLGLSSGSLGSNPIRVDIPNPVNLRVPSGNELGANDYFLPGGITSGGIREATIDPVPQGSFKVTPIFKRRR